MKITHINTLDRGGAAKACTLIHKALLGQGVESKMLILNPTKSEKEMYVFNYWNNTRGRFHALKKGIDMMLYDRKLRHRSQTLPPYNGMFTFPTTIYDITENEHYQSADIVQLNWTSGFLNEQTFFDKNKKPIVWRMADLYITGAGFHYGLDTPTDSFRTYLQENINIRNKALNTTNLDLTIVPISSWVEAKANESNLTKRFPKKLISCGVDTDIYKPYDSKLVRTLLGLPLNKKIILFGADSLSDKRKGITLLLEALNMINLSQIQLVSFGGHPIKSDLNIINLGYINDEKLLAMLYSAADLYITPAMEEAFGQTSIEAQACGATLITFPTGGGIDILEGNKQLGEIAQNVDAASLKDSIQVVLNTTYDKQYIVESTIKRFDINQKAKEYIELYKSILNK